MRTYAYGFPRLGRRREYKRLIEGFWAGRIGREAMLRGLEALERERLATYRAYVDLHPTGEMSLYDPLLDMALVLGLYPEAVAEEEGLWPEVEAYFRLARGEGALELTKWFNTNYHHLVPEIRGGFRLAWRRPLAAWRAAGGGLPYLIGPYTFLRLSKGYDPADLPRLLAALTPVYAELIRLLSAAGAEAVHLDEPALALEVPEAHRAPLREAYRVLGEAGGVILFVYYDDPDLLGPLYDLPLKGMGLDLVHGRLRLEEVGFPKGWVLAAGLLDGRNVWRTDLAAAARRVEGLVGLGAELWLTHAGPLYHLPYSLEGEEALEPALRERLAFARERLEELRRLKALLGGDRSVLDWNAYRHSAEAWVRPEVRARVQALQEEDFRRALPYPERRPRQIALPLFPTTTIGSFPQTEELRKARTALRQGRMGEAAYRELVRARIREAIGLQEEIGLDVLVHGEFERSDMVEFFAERLEGFAFTQEGWVLSYGTRTYRPPILYGDVRRPRPMTLEEIGYAQSLTDRPVKGMLTGPLTLLAWSYVRQDLPLEAVAYQLALAIRDEVEDLERAGIRVVQMDEPAFRELAPLKRRDWPAYFAWAVRAFRLASRARPETQVHTHMCYSEFSEILPYIEALDADVLSLEAARSRGEVIAAFAREGYAREVGPGTYDVHSPAVPSPENIRAILERALEAGLRPEQLWVNPDCGLKTRRWEEVIPALRNMVAAAQALRRRF